MSFNGSGVFVINSTGQPVSANTLIEAATFNAFTADVATGLSTAITKDGQTTVTANLPMGGYKHTGVATGTARDHYSAIAQLQDGTPCYGTVGGTADAIELTLTPAIAAYAAGQVFRFVASGANTTAVTLAVSGLASPKAITKNGTTALVAGDIPSGAVVEVVYDGTRFQIVGSAANPQFTTIELGHASDTTLTRVSAGVMAVEGVTLLTTATGMQDSTARIQTCWIPAGAMVARTTNGAAAGTVETTTNKNMIKTLDFDATTAEYAQFSINMPKGWDEGTVTAAFVWSHAATTTNFGVAWELAGVAVSDDDAMDVAFGTAGTVTDTGGTTNDCYITAATSAITIAGTPAVNDLVMFQVNRAPANGSDTMAIDARLHGIRLMYSINTLTDA